MNNKSIIDISVIVPIYNVSPFIEKSLHSLFSQTKTSGVEYILVNDATPDNSMQIAQGVIENYPHLNVKIIDKLENEGLAAARQSGLELATGDYIITIDSDDWVEPTLFKEAYTSALNNNADIVIFDFYLSYTDREVVYNQTIPADPIDIIQGMLLNEIQPSIWSKLIRRSLFTENGISWVKGINMGEDLLMCTKLFSFSKRHYHLQKPYIHYFANPNSMTNTLSLRSIEDLINVTQHIEQHLKKYNLFDHLNHSLLDKKLEYKAIALIMLRGYQQRHYTTIFPETDIILWDSKRIHIINKIAIQLALQKYQKLSNFIFRIAKLAKQIRRHI